MFYRALFFISGIATVQMFISFCSVVLDKIDLSALNCVCHALFIVDVVESPEIPLCVTISPLRLLVVN